MFHSNRGSSRFGGGRDFKRPEFGRRDFSDRPMHKATCAKCGAPCEVPFKPTGERPVYCSKCFENNRHSDSKRYESKADYVSEKTNVSGKTEEHLKRQFETLNWKLDKILKIIVPVAAPIAVQEEKIKNKVKVFKPKKPTSKSSKKEKLAVKEASAPKV